MLKVWSDFAEWGEDEATFVESGVGKGERWEIYDKAIAEEEIEVDNAGTFGRCSGAVATHNMLDGEERV